MATTSELRSKCEELQNLFESKDLWTDDDLSNFEMECIFLFDELKLPIDITRGFTTLFNPFLLEDKQQVGLFRKSTIMGNLGKYEKNKSSIHEKTVYKVFDAVYKKLEIMEDELSLVPKVLLNEIKRLKELDKIHSILNGIENCHQNRIQNELLVSANALLNEILDFIPECKAKRELSQKLSWLQSNHSDAEKFGFSKEMIIAFNNSRIIRNDDYIHLKSGASTIPYITAISYAYLVIMQLKIMLGMGIIKVSADDEFEGK